MTPSAKLKQLWDARIAVIERERDEARQRLAAAEAELDSVADAIGTIRLDTAIGPSQKDAIMDVITHIDRFLRANRGVRK